MTIFYASIVNTDYSRLNSFNTLLLPYISTNFNKFVINPYIYIELHNKYIYFLIIFEYLFEFDKLI
jgi:hypothetical protein